MSVSSHFPWRLPARSDLTWLKRFLDETDDCNQRSGDRLAGLLTSLLPTAAVPATPQALADRLTAIFRRVLQVASATGVLPPN